jgi:DNA-binding transcriptional ArsR family regulator
MTNPPIADLEQMRETAQIAASVLRAMANEDRLLLLCQLSLGEKSVRELEDLKSGNRPCHSS